MAKQARYFTEFLTDSPELPALLAEPWLRVIATYEGDPTNLAITAVCFPKENAAQVQAHMIFDDYPVQYWWDRKHGYEIRADSITLHAQFTKHPPGEAALRRKYRGRRRQAAKTRRIRAKDKAACATLEAPGCLRGRPSLFFPTYRPLRYGKPGGESCFRFRFHKARGDAPLPLLIFFHSAGSPGFDGYRPLCEFTLPWRALQRSHTRCHTVVPQLGFDELYNSDAHSQTLGEVIDWVAESTGTLDRSRIYLAGISYGGHCAIYECYRHPARYAGAVPCVGWIYLPPGQPEVTCLYDANDPYHSEFDAAGWDSLAQTPLWLAYSCIEKAHNEPVQAAMEARQADCRATRIDKGGHGMSRYFLPKTAWVTWLFQQRKPHH
ncbi:MAG: hypothetical protein LBS96_08485 [Oscillospiraceae bacterium]|jgi:hypothetical protein|nr:hypothetical protein [Oscillospiraceae bacterium]